MHTYEFCFILDINIYKKQNVTDQPLPYNSFSQTVK